MIFTGTTAELRDAIVAGTDVTSPVSFPGKVTLNQLNAFSGTLHPEALTNFMTLKVLADGSVEETNVAKLLIDLQSGSGVEDAKEEALIDARRAEADVNIRAQLIQLGNAIQLNNLPAIDYSLIEKPDYSYSFARDARGVLASAEAADGERTIFKPLTFAISSKKPLVFLNGVLVKNGFLFEGDEMEVSTVNGLAYSVEFATAPQEGSKVEFYFDDAVIDGDDERADVITKLADFNTSHSDFVNAKEGSINTLQMLRASEQSNIATYQASAQEKNSQIADKIEEIDNAKSDLEAASTVGAVGSIKSSIETLYSELEGLKYDLAGFEFSIENAYIRSNAFYDLIDKQTAIANADQNESMAVIMKLEAKLNAINSAKSTLGYNPPV